MPVRTSAVVAGVLAVLAVTGVITIFGDSLLAVIAPPPVEVPSAAAPGAAGGAGTNNRGGNP